MTSEPRFIDYFFATINLEENIMKSIFFAAKSLALLAVLLLAGPQVAAAGSSNDVALAKAVQEKLMSDTSFDATSIIVTSEDGVVHLRGSVNTEKEVEPMKTAAESVPGVQRVETQIDVNNGNR